MQKIREYVSKLLKLQDKIEKKEIGLQGSLFLMVLSFILAVLLAPGLTLPRRSLVEGENAPFNMRSQKSFEIVDEEATARLKDSAENAIKSVYDYDPKLHSRMVRKLFKAFERIKKDFYKEEKISLSKEDFLKAKESFEESLGGIKISENIFSQLERTKFNWTMAWRINGLLNLLKNRTIISEKIVLEADIDKGIIIRNLDDKKEIYFDEFDKILDLQEARKIIFSANPKAYVKQKDGQSHILQELAQALISSNLSFNKEETQQRKNQAINQISPIVIKIKRNEMIIRKADVVQKRHLVILKGIQKEFSKQRPLLLIFFTALILFCFFQVLGYFSLASFTRFKPSYKDIVIMGLLLVLALFFTRIYLFIAGAVIDKFTWIPTSVFLYFIPAAAVSMLVRFLMGLDAAFIFAIAQAIVLSLFLEKNFLLAIYFLTGSLIGIHGVAICRALSNIYRAGFKVGLANIVIVLGIILVSSLESGQAYSILTIELFLGTGAAFLAGILSSFLVVTVTPACEYLFDYTTDLKLLELSNLNHPLLREFMIRAPGSYHHSLMVGTLAESGAEAIGANVLLARVGGYYHDIGKMKNPHYYIENQLGGINIHDRQPAHLSRTMIMSHVKDGAKMAEERLLGKPIIDIIEQHLGTTTMVYFYSKAKKEYAERSKKDELLPPVNENDFRYPGPKPQTKEAAIVMLSDAVEASTRAFASSNLSRLRIVCEKVANRVFADGQLNESELTLKDLHQIVDSFYHVLVGVYHKRISYPGGIQAELQSYDANYSPKPAKEDQSSSSQDSPVDADSIFKKGG